MRCIDADALFERACNLEAQALAYVGKIVNDELKIEEWKIWSAILAERTAFKHDVFDAPTIEPQCKKGKWIYKDDLKQFFCSECGNPSLTYDDTYIYGMDLPNFCEDCGADMREPEDIPMEYFESGGR